MAKLNEKLLERLFRRVIGEIEQRATTLKRLPLSPANHKDIAEILKAVARIQNRPMQRMILKPNPDNSAARESKKEHLHRLQELVDSVFLAPRTNTPESVRDAAEYLMHALETEIDYLDWRTKPRLRPGAPR